MNLDNFGIMIIMTSTMNTKLKLLSISITILVAVFTFFVWIVGPIQKENALNIDFLSNLYQNTAFKSCEIISNTQIDTNIKLAQCQVNETHVVWLSLSENAKVIARKTWLFEEYQNQIESLKIAYPDSSIAFSYIENSFVFNIKTFENEVFLNIDTKQEVMRLNK